MNGHEGVNVAGGGGDQTVVPQPGPTHLQEDGITVPSDDELSSDSDTINGV